MTFGSGLTPSESAAIGAGGPGLFHRVSWAIVDQGLSSLSNFFLAVAVARFVTAEDFGAFGVAFAGYLLALGIARSLTSEPFIVRHSGLRDGSIGENREGASGTSLVVGVAGSVVLVAVSSLVDQRISQTMVATAAVLPFLLVQDLWRYVLIALGNPKKAAVNDALWLLLQLLGTVILIENDRFAHSPSTWVLMWGACGAIAAVVGALQCRTIPRIDRVRWWWQAEQQLMWRFCAESVIAVGWVPITLLALAAMSGLDAAASLRGAQAVFGPLFVIVTGLMAGLLPEAVRVLEVAPRRLTPLLATASGAVALASVVLTIVLLLTPDRAGRAILGASWSGTHKIVIFYGLAMAASCLALGASAGLRALQAISISLRRRMATAPALFICPIVGASFRGAQGFALGFFLAALLQAAILWRGYHKAMASHARYRCDESVIRPLGFLLSDGNMADLEIDP